MAKEVKKLESDFKMYDGAITDLEMHSGDGDNREAIEALRSKRMRVGQAINILSCPSFKGGKSCFFVKNQ
ncbi:MAG: hypothetical protein ABIE43_04225 [Patescibacteria group bacterium]